MKPKIESEALAKAGKQQTEKDRLQVRGNFNLSVGIQIFGLENQSKREKIFKLVVLASLIILILVVILITNDANLNLSLSKIIEKFALILQAVMSSSEIITRFFKDPQMPK